MYGVLVIQCHGHRRIIEEMVQRAKEVKEGFSAAADTQEEGCRGKRNCVPYVQCPAHVRDGIEEGCHVSDGRLGICCSTGQNHTGY